MKNKKNKSLTKSKIFVFVICLIISFSPGILGSFFTSSQTNSDWYESVRPSITPPRFIFPIVWNILFLMIGTSLYFAWINSNNHQKKLLKYSFGINLALNLLWSIFYFKMQNPFLAFIDIIFLIISIVAILVITYRIKRLSFYLIIPYLVWVCFASVLNYLSIN
jgi:translocator protein